jgi:hypothetical protein
VQGDDISAAMKIVAGDSVSQSAVIQMPSGAWTAALIAKTDTGEAFNFDAAFQLVGPNADNPDKYDWALALSAPASRTATWNTVGGKIKNLSAVLRFTDNSPEPVVITSNSFEINILPVP